MSNVGWGWLAHQPLVFGTSCGGAKPIRLAASVPASIPTHLYTHNQPNSQQLSVLSLYARKEHWRVLWISETKLSFMCRTPVYLTNSACKGAVSTTVVDRLRMSQSKCWGSTGSKWRLNSLVTSASTLFDVERE